MLSKCWTINGSSQHLCLRSLEPLWSWSWVRIQSGQNFADLQLLFWLLWKKKKATTTGSSRTTRCQRSTTNARNQSALNQDCLSSGETGCCTNTELGVSHRERAQRRHRTQRARTTRFRFSCFFFLSSSSSSSSAAAAAAAALKK